MNIESYNKALSRLGLEEFLKFFEIFKTSAKTPIISVGSGVGSVETYLEDLLNVQITCVDPAPTSYQDQTDDPQHLPDHPLVESMIKEHPEFVRNSSLFLNWPTPSNGGDNYDMRAVQQLQPKFIFAVVETSGGGGGSEFLSWLKESVIQGDFFEDDEEYYYVIDDVIGESVDRYHTIGQHMARQESGGGTLFFKYIIMRREDVEIPDNFQRVDTCLVLDDDTNSCIVM